ncbi:hypothetical protein EMB1_00002 [Bacteroides phage EMB1]|nr:hypothetical protein EMB1_00002 [Bacteroides phage EMB1]
MACITKLADAIAYDCDTGATGLVSALIINKSDIVSFTHDAPNTRITNITLSTGAKAYKIDTVKRSLVLSETLKVNDGAPNAYSHSASLVLTAAPSGALRALRTAFTNGSFVIIAKRPGALGIAVYGLYYGLSATAADYSSHDNGGWTTVTLETPENVIGEDTLMVEADVYTALYAAAIG